MSQNLRRKLMFEKQNHTWVIYSMETLIFEVLYLKLVWCGVSTEDTGGSIRAHHHSNSLHPIGIMGRQPKRAPAFASSAVRFFTERAHLPQLLPKKKMLASFAHIDILLCPLLFVVLGFRVTTLTRFIENMCNICISK
jgi:hypothetical protein